MSGLVETHILLGVLSVRHHIGTRKKEIPVKRFKGSFDFEDFKMSIEEFLLSMELLIDMFMTMIEDAFGIRRKPK